MHEAIVWAEAIKLEISGKSWKSLIKNSSWNGNCEILEVASYSTKQGHVNWSSRGPDRKFENKSEAEFVFLKINCSSRLNQKILDFF